MAINLYNWRFLRFLFIAICVIFLLASCGMNQVCIGKDATSVKDNSGANASLSGKNSPVSIIETVLGSVLNQLYGSPIGGINSGNRHWEDGAVYRIYNGIVGDAKFQVVFYLSVVLMLTFLGASFTLGLLNITIPELSKHLWRMSVVIFFVNPSGWEVYNSFIVGNILSGSRYFNRVIIASMYNTSIENVQSPFQPIDLILRYISVATFFKLIGMFFSNGVIYGFILCVIICHAMLTFILVFAKAVILYVTTLVMSAVLLSVGPIFFVFYLFDKTDSFFKKWITGLFGLFLQQYLLFIGFFIFCVIGSSLIAALLFFEACWMPVMSIHFMIPMPAWLKDLIMGIIQGINYMLAALKIFGIDEQIGSDFLPDRIVDLSIPFIFFFASPLSLITVGPGLFDGASLFVVALIFSKFVETISDIGAEIAGADLKASGFAKGALDGITAAQGKVDEKATEQIKSAYKNPARISDGLKQMRNNTWANSTKSGILGSAQRGLGSIAKLLGQAGGAIDKGPLGLLANKITGKKGDDIFRSSFNDAFTALTQPANDETKQNRATLDNHKMARQVFAQEFEKLKNENKKLDTKDQLSLSDIASRAEDAARSHVLEHGKTGKVDASGKEIKFNNLEEVNRSLGTTINTSAITKQFGEDAKFVANYSPDKTRQQVGTHGADNALKSIGAKLTPVNKQSNALDFFKNQKDRVKYDKKYGSPSNKANSIVKQDGGNGNANNGNVDANKSVPSPQLLTNNVPKQDNPNKDNLIKPVSAQNTQKADSDPKPNTQSSLGTKVEHEQPLKQVEPQQKRDLPQNDSNKDGLLDKSEDKK